MGKKWKRLLVARRAAAKAAAAAPAETVVDEVVAETGRGDRIEELRAAGVIG